MKTDSLESQLEALQQQLATRDSTLHFTHAGIAAMVSMIFGGAAAKLFWDSAKVPYLGFLTAALTLGLIVYGVVRYRRGRASLALELERFAKLESVRRELKLDDPASLLPNA